MRDGLPEPGPGGFMDIPLPGSGYVVKVRGKCGPADDELAGVTFLGQVHGTEILRSPSGFEEGDGMVFPRGEGCPGIRVADCLPLLVLSDSSVGAAHCGWRGIVGGIVTGLMESIPGNPTHVFLGPRICPDCYRTGDDVRTMITGTDPGGEEGHPSGGVDLGFTVSRQIGAWLETSGIDPGSVPVTDTGICTCCHADHFHSWRRERLPDRNLVWLSPEGSIARGW